MRPRSGFYTSDGRRPDFDVARLESSPRISFFEVCVDHDARNAQLRQSAVGRRRSADAQLARAVSVALARTPAGHAARAAPLLSWTGRGGRGVGGRRRRCGGE